MPGQGLDKNAYLKIILLFSALGMIFSGYLSWGEIFPSATPAFGCAVASAKILGVPTCVYGFLMYLVIGILSILALRS